MVRTLLIDAWLNSIYIYTEYTYIYILCILIYIYIIFLPFPSTMNIHRRLQAPRAAAARGRCLSRQRRDLVAHPSGQRAGHVQSATIAESVVNMCFFFTMKHGISMVYTLWLCHNSYGNWSFIVAFQLKIHKMCCFYNQTSDSI